VCVCLCLEGLDIVQIKTKPLPWRQETSVCVCAHVCACMSTGGVELTVRLELSWNTQSGISSIRTTPTGEVVVNKMVAPKRGGCSGKK